MQLVMLAVLVTIGVIVHRDQLLVKYPSYSYACSQTRTFCFGVGFSCSAFRVMIMIHDSRTGHHTHLMLIIELRTASINVFSILYIYMQWETIRILL